MQVNAEETLRRVTKQVYEILTCVRNGYIRVQPGNKAIIFYNGCFQVMKRHSKFAEHGVLARRWCQHSVRVDMSQSFP